MSARTAAQYYALSITLLAAIACNSGSFPDNKPLANAQEIETTGEDHTIDITAYDEAIKAAEYELGEMSNPGPLTTDPGPRKKLKEAEDKIVQTIVDKADALKAAGQFGDALRCYHWALEMDPSNTRAKTGIGAISPSYDSPRRESSKSVKNGRLPINNVHE